MSSKQSIITRIIIIALIVITAASIIVGCNANNDIDSNTSDPTASTVNSTEQTTFPVDDETTDTGTNVDSNDPTIPTTSPTEETAVPTVTDQGETGESDPNNGNNENADNTETEGNQNETTQPTTPNDGGEGGNTDTGNNPAQGEDKKPSETEPIETKPVETEPAPTEPPKSWSTAPGTRPYEYQEIFSILDFERCGIYQHCDRYGNVWIDRSPSSNGYGKTIYSNWLFNSDLHYYGDGIWSNFGAWWSEDGSRSGGSFSMTLGAAIFPDIGSGEYVAPYGPQETVSGYIQACANALVGYNEIMNNETWSDEKKAEEAAAFFVAMGVKEADVIGYRDNPTTHPFPGVD